MRKNTRLKVPVTVSLDYEYLKQFEEKNKGLLSAQINEMLREVVTNEKNEEAQLTDPLGLSNLTQSRDNHTRQSTLFETFAARDRRDEIDRFVNSVKDTDTLNQIEKNCKCMLGIASTRRREIMVYPRR